jgi:aldose 1-epimerase
MSATVELQRDGQRAEIDAIGASLRSWWAGGADRVSFRERTDPARAFDGATLVPWPGRIRDGVYEFAGRRHRLAISEPRRGSALHGLAARAPWGVVGRSGDAVRLRCAAGPAPGYPFSVVTEVTYRLRPGGLAVELEAFNFGQDPAPFGCGSHPYLRTPRGVDAAGLSVPAATFVPPDERLLPAGPPRAIDGFAARELGPATVDACFGGLRRDDDGLARVRIRPAPDEPQITLWLDEGFGFVHVYTDDDAPDPSRRRARLAVEPVSCAPDAFNTGLGLLTLHPGERFVARWGLEMEGT